MKNKNISIFYHMQRNYFLYFLGVLGLKLTGVKAVEWLGDLAALMVARATPNPAIRTCYCHFATLPT